VIEEAADERSVDLRKLESGRLSSESLQRVGEQQPKCIPIRGDGVRARLALSDQPIDEKTLEK